MRQKYRTTCFADALVDYPGSLEDDPKWREEVVGFRLVHDDAERVVAGSAGHYPARIAGKMGKDLLLPQELNIVVGIRLVVDWRHE